MQEKPYWNLSPAILILTSNRLGAFLVAGSNKNGTTGSSEFTSLFEVIIFFMVARAFNKLDFPLAFAP